MNYVVLVGKVKEIKDNVLNVEVNKKGNGQDKMDVKILITEYMLKSMLEYLVVGDIVGIRGSLDNLNNEIVILCEKLSFLSSKNNEKSGE